MKVGDAVYHKARGKKVTILQEFSSHFLCEDANDKFSCSKRPGVDLLEVHDGGVVGEIIPDVINVNAATADELAKFLPAIGKFSARKIVTKKPEGGYVNLNNLRDINPDLTLNWEEVGPKLQF